MRAPLLAVLAGLWGAVPATAQGVWDAMLTVDPVPSPYLSDWEANPHYGTLTVFNGSGQTQSVRLAFSVVDGMGRVLASGRSEPQTVLADAPSIFDDPFEIAGSTTHDTGVEAQMRRTGRLPEGDYRACVAVVDLSGFQLAEACESFSVVYPDPPLLVAPYNAEAVSTQDFFFQWMPSQVPVSFDVRYVLEVAEVRPGQLPYEALTANILHLVEPDLFGSQLQYPLSAQPLEPGKTYAWRVRALDVNGYPVAANEGSSEIWTFTMDGGDEVATRSTPTDGETRSYTFTIGRADVPASGAVLGASLNRLCTEQQPVRPSPERGFNDFSVWAPFFRTDTIEATVYYAVERPNQLRPSLQWAVHAGSATRPVEYFARGDCDGPEGDEATLYWIARKRTQHGISDFLADAFGWNREEDDQGGRVSADHEGIELDFGVAVLSLRDMDVGGSDLFPAENDFFRGNDFGVLPGLNAYGIVWLPEGGLWGWLRQFGWDQNKFELQGFVGMANTVTLGAEYESDQGGELDATLQQKFLVLRIGFPERTPQFLPFIRTMQAGIEFSVEDTLTTGVGPATETKAELHLVPKLTWTWDISDNVEITWSGGFDYSRGVERTSETTTGTDAETRRSTSTTTKGWETSSNLDLVLAGECDCVWESPGRGAFWIGNPKLELHYKLTTRDELTLVGAFQFGWADIPPITAGGSLTWSAPPNLPSPLRELHAISMQTRDDRFRALDRLKMLEADGAPLAELTEAREALRRAEELDQSAFDALMKATKDANVPDIKPGKFDWKHPTWRVRLAAGNVGFLELFSFVRSLFP